MDPLGGRWYANISIVFTDFGISGYCTRDPDTRGILSSHHGIRIGTSSLSTMADCIDDPIFLTQDMQCYWLFEKSKDIASYYCCLLFLGALWFFDRNMSKTSMNVPGVWIIRSSVLAIARRHISLYGRGLFVHKLPLQLCTSIPRASPLSCAR